MQIPNNDTPYPSQRVLYTYWQGKQKIVAMQLSSAADPEGYLEDRISFEHWQDTYAPGTKT